MKRFSYPTRAYAPMAIPIALSLALMAFLLMLCGCTVREEPRPNVNRRHVDVQVDVDVRRPRPVCPDCPLRRAGCDCGCVGGCDCDQCEHPVMNLPQDARCKNYNGGSCVCASTISLFRWQGRDDLAAALRNVCSGGQSSSSLHAKLERLGARYAATTSGDVSFLEWAVRTRRGCGIAYYPMHFVNLVDLTADHATLLDNNRVGQYITVPRAEFISRWRGFGGWATAVVYSPAAPIAKK